MSVRATVSEELNAAIETEVSSANSMYSMMLVGWATLQYCQYTNLCMRVRALFHYHLATNQEHDGKHDSDTNAHS